MFREIAVRLCAASVVLIGAPSLVHAQSRTAWQMHDGLEVTPQNPPTPPVVAGGAP